MEQFSDALGRSGFGAQSMGEFFGPPKPLVLQLGTKEAICPAHSMYLTTGTQYTTGPKRQVWTPCPSCVAERVEESKAQARQEEQAREAERIVESFGRAAIPSRFIGRTFDNFIAETPDQARALATVRDYAEDFYARSQNGDSLLLLGQRGTGKTHLAVAVLQSLLPQRVGLYVTAPDLIGMVRDTWRKDSERSESQVLAMLSTVPLLVIDEVGVQYGTESEQQTLFQVIDRRYREKRPMILMANCKVDGVKDILGDPVFDRMRQVAKAVLFEWDSFRPRAKKEGW